MGGHVLLASILLTSWTNEDLHWPDLLNLNPTQPFKYSVYVFIRWGVVQSFIVMNRKRAEDVETYSKCITDCLWHVLDLLMRIGTLKKKKKKNYLLRIRINF